MSTNNLNKEKISIRSIILILIIFGIIGTVIWIIIINKNEYKESNQYERKVLVFNNEFVDMELNVNFKENEYKFNVNWNDDHNYYLAKGTNNKYSLENNPVDYKMSEYETIGSHKSDFIIYYDLWMDSYTSKYIDLNDDGFYQKGESLEEINSEDPRIPDEISLGNVTNYKNKGNVYFVTLYFDIEGRNDLIIYYANNEGHEYSGEFD